MEKSFLHFFLGSDPERHRKILKSLKAKADAKRTVTERIADWMTSHFGTMFFLTLNVIIFFLWLLINTGKISGMPIFDPFPFNLLTTVVSLEAIMLAIFVLISQNRAARVDDVREETHLQIDLITEKEVTKVLKLLTTIAEKNGIDLSQDPELQKMLKPVSADDLEKMLEKEIS